MCAEFAQSVARTKEFVRKRRAPAAALQMATRSLLHSERSLESQARTAHLCSCRRSECAEDALQARRSCAERALRERQ
eukprot:1715038-Pleurochrysis_carterae.AAC.1